MEPTQPKQEEEPHQQHEDKNYISSKKRWKDFKLHQDIIASLLDQGKTKPTRVQSDSLAIATNPDRKKFNILIRAINGAGKTLAFLIPMLNAYQPGLPIAQDKTFKGKVIPNEIFKPQGILIVQTNLLQTQLEEQLKIYLKYGEDNDREKLKFKIGKAHKQGHQPGDFIVMMPQSFLNRYSRGNLKLDQCHFIAIDQIDQIYDQNKQDLKKLLEIVDASPSHVIACSATMKGEFMKFYSGVCPNFQALNVIKNLQDQLKKKIKLEGVGNYYKVVEGGKVQMHKYIIQQLFKHLYKSGQKNKPQVFIFFNSVNEINQFNQYFQTIASDHTTEQSEYLESVSRDIIAAKTFKNQQKVQTTIEQKNEAMAKFRNGQTNILLATNIIARGIDIRNACFVINVGAPKRKQNQQSVDVDTYLHRVGRTGRHNDKGVALTLMNPGEVKPLLTGVEKFHKINLIEMKSPQDIVKQVFECIQWNSK